MNIQLPKDQSFGIIPLRKHAADWEVFIIQHTAGHWGFPKGHVKTTDKNPHETAQRELTEETGLQVEHFLSIEPLSLTYECISHKCHVDKTVTYFTAVVHGTIRFDVQEVIDGRWVTLSQATELVDFEQTKKLVKQLQKKLNLHSKME